MAAEYFCSTCGSPFLSAAPLDEHGRCQLCRRELRGFDSAYSYGEYDDVLRKLIHLFKYGGLHPLAGELGRMMNTALPRDARPDVIVPMPMHWKRRLHRGYNQAELLARTLSRRRNVPLRKAVRRRKATPAQAGLTGAQRRVNVTGAFEVTNPEAVKGLHILLVDDVLTTGATAASCAQALKRAGASRVTLLTLARADRRKGIAGAAAIS